MVRSLDAAAGGVAIATAQGANTIAGGSTCVTSRGTDADASADIHVDLDLKLKPDTYDGTVPLREFFAQFELIARASRWNEMTKIVFFLLEGEGVCGVRVGGRFSKFKLRGVEIEIRVAFQGGTPFAKFLCLFYESKVKSWRRFRFVRIRSRKALPSNISERNICASG